MNAGWLAVIFLVLLIAALWVAERIAQRDRDDGDS